MTLGNREINRDVPQFPAEIGVRPYLFPNVKFQNDSFNPSCKVLGSATAVICLNVETGFVG